MLTRAVHYCFGATEVLLREESIANSNQNELVAVLRDRRLKENDPYVARIVLRLRYRGAEYDLQVTNGEEPVPNRDSRRQRCIGTKRSERYASCRSRRGLSPKVALASDGNRRRGIVVGSVDCVSALAHRPCRLVMAFSCWC